MEQAPEILARSVTDRDSFLAFLSALAENWNQSQRLEAQSPSSPYGSAALGWENVSVGTFLEAAHAWAADSNRFPQQCNWAALAQLLIAGKSYE